MFSWKNKKKNKSKFSKDMSDPDRYLDLAIANNNKRKIIYSLILLLAFVLFILGTVTVRTNTRVYIVEKEGNNYTYFGYVNDLTRQTYNPDDNSLIFFMDNFVKKIRTLSTDLVLYKKNYDESKFFVNSRSNGKLEDILTENDYRGKIENRYAVDIDILSTLRLSPSSFQVRWIEKIYDQGGREISRELLVGVFQYEIKKPKNVDSIKINPLGMIITDLNISVEKKF
ncbi:type IV secretion system protein [Fusobacterium necrophorum]|uniref:type IV secretion system protein n=1 Tax=Fusobacterium necrophorum TaxID=859 RepID=UPI00370EC516